MLITGGSRGIGAVTATRAAEAGYAVCISYASNAEAAASVVADCEAAGATAQAVQADVAVEAEVIGLFKAASQMGDISAVIINAGVLEPMQRLDQFSFDRVSRIMAVNVTGAIMCAREAVKAMSTRNGGAGGAIVNVSSAASYLGSPNEFIDYAASKGAMDTMTIGLAKEVADEGIRVNAVRPGLIYTDIHSDAGDPNRVDRLAENVPMKRGGQAIEVADAILWLASDQASYVSGTLLNVSGGR